MSFFLCKHLLLLYADTSKGKKKSERHIEVQYMYDLNVSHSLLSYLSLLVWQCMSAGVSFTRLKRKSHLTISTSKRIKSRTMEAPDFLRVVYAQTHCSKELKSSMLSSTAAILQPPIYKKPEQISYSHPHSIMYTVLHTQIDEHQCQEMQVHYQCGLWKMFQESTYYRECVCFMYQEPFASCSIFNALFILFYTQHLLLVLYTLYTCPGATKMTKIINIFTTFHTESSHFLRFGQSIDFFITD